MSYRALILQERYPAMIEIQLHDSEEKQFAEFRRKVRSAELLSAAMQRLLQTIRFNGRLSLLVQNGQVLKSGYEEGYFRQPQQGSAARMQ
ncbi:MAG: hypothetical protein ACLQFM_15415 [Terriglobales bacterium]|jgi:hypothetical protein